MAICPVKLDGPTQKQFPDGPGLVFKLMPEGYAYQHDCTVHIYINGTEVTGTGDFGGCHVSGKGGDFIIIQPVPHESKKVPFTVDCPDCHWQDSASWWEGYQPVGFLDKLLKKVFLIFWSFPIVGIGILGVYTWIFLRSPLLYLEQILKGHPSFIEFLNKFFGRPWHIFGGGL